MPSGSTKTQIVFILLQLADIVTTMTALQMGAGEQNAVIRRFMVIGSLQGLILSKVLILAIALAILVAGKTQVLRWANVVFVGVVVWNLLIIARLAWGHGA